MTVGVAESTQRVAVASAAKRPSYHQFLVASELGGAGMVALQIAAFLSRNGLESRVWTPGRGPALDEARRRGLEAQEFDTAQAFNPRRLIAAWGNWKIASRLRRWTRGLVHVHGPSCYGALHWGLKLSGFKRVVHVQIEESEPLLQWAFQHPPELIITCAQFLVPQVRHALPPRFQEQQQIEALPNPVDTDRFFPGDKLTAKVRVGASVTRPLVLVLANLAPHKGQETAIRTIALLKRKQVDLACWLVGTERGGTQTYTARLQSLVRELEVTDRVHFLGQRGDVPQLLRAADFLLLPSTHEGLPLAILEAQATKVPVLAAATAGVPEVVRHGQTGFLIAAKDVPGYAACLQGLLNNRDLYHQVADRAHAQVTEFYSSNRFCRRMVELYHRTSLSGNG
jgi:glycosyltransferase involved in cell wall biosynthesis